MSATAAKTPPIAGRWRLRLAAVVWFVAGLAFLLALPILLQATGWALPAAVVLSGMLALPIAWLIHKSWRRDGSFVGLWLKWGLALLFVLSALLAAPVYYFASVTQLTPALVPQVVLTDGRKTVVFQGMQHVGSEQFYKSVVYDLEEALSRGYVLYYEGVRPSTPEADAWLNETVTGGKDLSQSYRALGGLCGLKFQNDYFQFLGRDAQAHPKSHVVADVSTLDLKQEYDRLISSDRNFADAMSARKKAEDSLSDAMEDVVEFFKKGTDGQRAMAGILCRGFMTLSIRKSDAIRSDDPLDKVILEYRNRELASRLLSEQNRHIYLTYGARHLPGVLSILQENDLKWHVASIKWLRTIDAPEDNASKAPAFMGGQ